MKKFENAIELNEIEMNAVVGGDKDKSVLDVFLGWLLGPHGGDSKRPLPFPQDLDPARPLPFPQDLG